MGGALITKCMLVQVKLHNALRDYFELDLELVVAEQQTQYYLNLDKIEETFGLRKVITPIFTKSSWSSAYIDWLASCRCHSLKFRHVFYHYLRSCWKTIRACMYVDNVYNAGHTHQLKGHNATCYSLTYKWIMIQLKTLKWHYYAVQIFEAHFSW